MHLLKPFSAQRTLLNRKTFFWFSLGALLLGSAIWFIFNTFGYKWAKSWAESPEGTRAAEHALGHAMKVDGTLAPLHLDRWHVTTDSFISTGWLGEAISSFAARDIQLELDPWSVLRGAWRVQGVEIAHLEVSLRPPNNQLKRPVPPKKPRPWYGYLLPSRFECGPIITPDANLEYTFRNENADISHAHLQADLIGKDFQYTATSGVVSMPYFPPLRIKKLIMLVTHSSLTISAAELTGLDPEDPAHLVVKGKMGMRQDKTIHADVEMTEMPLENILPPDLQPLLHGRATGKLTWSCDATGQNISSRGTLALNQAGMTNLSIFRELSVLHSNPDLNNFTLDQATCDYILENNELHLTLRAQASQKFSLLGTIIYNLSDKQAQLTLTFRDLPLHTWLPQELKTGTTGIAAAEVTWQGILSSVKNSTGTVALHLDGAEIGLPDTFRRLLIRKGLRSPDTLQLQKAELDFDYHDETFFLKQGELLAPNQVNAQIKGRLNSKQKVEAQVDWQGFKIENWLPSELADQFHGDMDGQAGISLQSWKMEHGSYAGVITLQHGNLRFTSLQVTLARFLNNRDLLDLLLTHATVSWVWKNGDIVLDPIDLRAADHFGLMGQLHVNAQKQLSGTLWIGLKPEYLKSFYGLAEDVFTRHENGLCWAQVEVSGTVKNPKQNLSEQITAQLWKHPFAVFGLGAKVGSWYLGNIFGADEEWTQPKP